MIIISVKYFVQSCNSFSWDQLVWDKYLQPLLPMKALAQLLICYPSITLKYFPTLNFLRKELLHFQVHSILNK